MKRLAAVLVAAGLVWLGVAAPASAMVPTDPWVPPSVAGHDGLAAGTLAIGGASVPLGGGEAADTLVVAPDDGDCWVHLTTWGWSGTTFTGNFDALGGYAGWCTGFQSHWLPTFGCVVTTVYADVLGVHELGSVIPRDWDAASIEWNSASIVISGVDCGANAELLSINLPMWTSPGNRSFDGLTAFRPGASALLVGNVTALTTCSDNSTYEATFLAGLPIVPAACLTGDLVSVTLSVDGVVIGKTEVHAPFVGNPCLTVTDGCALKVTSASGSCTNRDESCSWWGFTDAATECAWQGAGAGELWALAPSDCEQARQDGYWMPHPIDPYTPPPSPSPTPPPSPVDGTPAIVRAVEAAAAAAVAATAAAASAVVNAVNGVTSGVAAIPGAIVRAVVPDVGVIGAATARAEGALGAPLSGWTAGLGDLAGAWGAGAGSCEGPVMRMPVFGSFWDFHPLDACSGYGAMFAPVVHLGATVLLLWQGAWGCARNLGGAFGYSA